MSIVVANIPPGVTIDAALAAIRGMSGVYPSDTLSLGNDPAGGMCIIHNPAAAPVGEPAPRATIALGVDEPGDLIAFAFSTDDQENALKALSLGLIGMLDTAEAANYLTFSVEHPEVGRYAVTIQRCDGKTPAERIAELEQRLAEVTA